MKYQITEAIKGIVEYISFVLNFEGFKMAIIDSNTLMINSIVNSLMLFSLIIYITIKKVVDIGRKIFVNLGEKTASIIIKKL